MSKLAWWSLLASALVSAPAAAQDAPSLDWGAAERRAYVFQAAQRGIVADVAFDADGRAFVATRSGQVSLVDTRTGVVLATARVASTSDLDLRALSVDPRGHWVLLAGMTARAGPVTRRWDLRTGATSDVPTGASFVDAFSPDGARFVAADEDTVVARTSSGRVSARASLETRGELSWPDARGIVLYAREGHVLEVLDPARLTVRATLPGALAIAIDAPRHRVLARTSDAIVAIDLRSGRETLRIARSLDAAAHPSLVASSDGSQVAVIDTPSSSSVVPLDGRAAGRAVEGAILWLSRTHAIIRALDGSIGRHLLATGARSSWVSRAPLPPDEGFFVGADGTAMFERAGHLEISAPDGTRHTLSLTGEYDVWWASADGVGARVALGGRFGLDVWAPTGVRAMSSCTRTIRHRFDASHLVRTDGHECDIAADHTRAFTGIGPAVSASGLVTGIEGGPVQLPAHRVCGDEYGCEVDLTLEAGGRYVVMTRTEGDMQDSWFDHSVYQVASGRVVVSFPRSARVAVDPQGRWAAAISAQHVSLVALPSGVALTHVGAPVTTGHEALSTPFAVAGDGSRLAVSDGRAVRVLDGTSGRLVANVAARGVDEIVLSDDGATIAVRAGRSMRSGSIAAPLGAPRDVEGPLAGVFCSSGRAYTLDRADPSLPMRDLGSCLGAAVLERGSLVATSEGAVRVRRLGSGRELTLRSIRRVQETDTDDPPVAIGPVIHFAHDDTGRYWSDAEGGVPVLIRGADGTLTPLDPALADPDLLTHFFAGP